MLAAEEVPKITDWMQAWGSLAGLVMSTAAVIFTGLLFRHEIRVRREEQRDNEAAQARLVFGRVFHYVRTDTNPETGQIEGPVRALAWEVKNYSGTPVLGLEVEIRPRFLDDAWIKVVNPVGHFDVLEQRVKGQAVLETPVVVGDSFLADPSRFVVEIEFIDSSGLYWKRYAQDPPERLV